MHTQLSKSVDKTEKNVFYKVHTVLDAMVLNAVIVICSYDNDIYYLSGRLVCKHLWVSVFHVEGI